MTHAVGGALNTDGSAVDKFLTPEAMLTPGAAGGITMLISNALVNNFSMPPAYISYIGLFISFLFGLLVMASAREWWIKLVYYVINSFIIFCVAFGTGNLIAPKGPPARSQTYFNVFSAAYANDTTGDELNTLQTQYKQLNEQYKKESEALAALQKNGASQSDIDKQNGIILKLQNEMAANLANQSSILSSRTTSSNAASNPSQVTGGPNSVVNHPGQLFHPWPSPFR